MTVEVRYLGHLGNNLFQYALGRILSEELGRELVCIPPLREYAWAKVETISGIVDRLSDHFGHFADAPQHIDGKVFGRPQFRYVYGEKPGWNGHGINLAHLLRSGSNRRIVLHGYFQRFEYYHPYRERIRRWFQLRLQALPLSIESDDLLVHLRRSPDMFVLDRAISLDFYLDFLSKIRFGRLLACGLGIGKREREALAPFRPIFLDLPAIPTLYLMTQVRRILLANSTFSWWGAFLSDAEVVYFPRTVRNYWGADRPEVDLEVPEGRYRYIDEVEVETWRPFEPASGAGLRIERPAGKTVILTSADPKMSGTRLGVREELLPVCRWLVERKTPFGLAEIDELEPPQRLRIEILALIVRLCRLGWIRAEQWAVDTVVGRFGLRPNSPAGGEKR